MKPRIVILGAGAVGVTYAHLLAKKGCEIVFLVREKYAAAVREGITVYAGKTSERLLPAAVITDAAQIEGAAQVWIAVPTTGMDANAIAELGKHTGEATIVDLMPDEESRTAKIIGRDRVVEVAIPFVAYQTPIPGEAPRPPGIAYWLPPAMTVTLSGPRAKSVAALLPTKTKIVNDLRPSRVFDSAVLMCAIWHVEAEGWNLARGMAAYDGAAKEALQIAERETGRKAGLRSLIVSPWLMRTLGRIAPSVTPFPLEAYMRYHFTKVGKQSHRGLQRLLERAEKVGVDAPQLRALNEKLTARTAPSR